MLAQADMGQSNMRDYADHYGRICDAVQIPVYVDADTGFGGVNNVRQMVRAFEDAGVAGLFISDQVFPNRCGYLPGKQIIPAEQMLAKVKAALDARRDPDLFIAARTDAAGVDVGRKTPSSAASFSWRPAPTWRSRWASTPSRRSSGRCAKFPGRTWRRCRRRRDRRRAAWQSWKPPASARRRSRRCRCSRRRRRCATCCGCSSASDSLAPCQDHLIPLDDYYDLVGLKDLLAREESYDKAAAALVQKRAAE